MNNNKIFNYINYFTIACIAPLGYFAPIGEWLLLSFLSMATLLNCLINKLKINLNHSAIFLIATLISFISYYWSINPERTSEVIGPISGILFGIYIVLNISSHNKIKYMDNLLGIPLLFTSILILSDIFLETEIRSNLAKLVGDQPTSKSANFSRGIIILTMMMPLSISLYINNYKNKLAFLTLLIVSLVILLGPNNSAKIALFCTVISFIIIYYFGPRSFLCFGIISFLFILFIPIISVKFFPILSNIEKNIELTKECVQSGPNEPSWKRIPNTNKCSQTLNWQESPSGGSVIHRLLIWEYVGNKILYKPLLGHGIGTSRLIGQNIILNIPYTKSEIKGAIPLHPHNNFLEIWLELGLLGIIVISFLWIKIIKFGIHIRKKSYIIGTGVCSSIVTTFVISNLSFGVFQAWWMASIGLIFLVILQTCRYEEEQ